MQCYRAWILVVSSVILQEPAVSALLGMASCWLDKLRFGRLKPLLINTLTFLVEVRGRVSTPCLRSYDPSSLELRSRTLPELIKMHSLTQQPGEAIINAVHSRQRDPRVLTGAPIEDVEEWIDFYNRVSLHNIGTT